MLSETSVAAEAMTPHVDLNPAKLADLNHATKNGPLYQNDHGEEIALQASSYLPGCILLKASDLWHISFQHDHNSTADTSERLVAHCSASQGPSRDDSKGEGCANIRDLMQLGNGPIFIRAK